MDAVKFVEERNRMCKSFGGECKGCPANDIIYGCRLSVFIGDEAAEQIKLVEEWSAAHPRKTRQRVFLEQYPEASCVDNILMSCPKVIDKNFSCSNTCFNCAECRREFWMQEAK